MKTTLCTIKYAVYTNISAFAVRTKDYYNYSVENRANLSSVNSETFSARHVALRSGRPPGRGASAVLRYSASSRKG